MAETQWIPLVAVDELPSDLNLMARKWIAMENGDPNFIQTVSHAPETLRRYIRWSSPMWRKGVIQNRTKEICRIRIANSNECRYCMTMRYETAQSQGLTKELEDQLGDYENGGFSDREKAALRYTDEILMDNLTWDYDRVPDDVYLRLAGQFSEPEIVELTWAICIAIEYGRNFTVWGVPVTEEKIREPLDELTERVQPKFGTVAEDHDRKILEQIARSRPDDAAALSTLLARPDMLTGVLEYYLYITDSGLLDASLKRAVKEKIQQLASGAADGETQGVGSPPIMAALVWTEGMAVDFASFVDNEEMATMMRAQFSDAEMVELGMYSGFNLALRRIGAVLGRRVDLASYGLHPVA